MSRFATILGLIAALSGTPLRQAEGASDLARALAESFQSDRLESPDGGIGDDSGVTVHGLSHASFSSDPLASSAPLLLPPPSSPSSLSPAEAEELRARVWWPAKPPNLRYAWLQFFLF